MQITAMLVVPLLLAGNVAGEDFVRTNSGGITVSNDNANTATNVPGRSHETRSGLAPGQYTGANQPMIIGNDGRVTYSDTPGMGICHLEITEDDRIKVKFPDTKFARGKSETMTLKLSAELSNKERRSVWTAVVGDVTYKATAVPYSPKAYVFRLEVIANGKLSAGAQQFYALEQKPI